MRIALLLRQRRVSLLMQRHPIRGHSTGPSPARFGSPLKRPASSAASALKVDDSRGSKHTRLDGQDSRDSTSWRRRGGSVFSGAGDAGTQLGKSGQNRPYQSRKGAPESLAERATSEPLIDETFITAKYADTNVDVNLKGSSIPSDWKKQPKGALSNFMSTRFNQPVRFEIKTRMAGRRKITRAKVQVTDDLTGIGDGSNKREAERVASLAACYEIIARELYKKAKEPAFEDAPTEVTLSDGSLVGFDKARQFMDYYCRKFRFGQPFIEYEEKKGYMTAWEAVMTVGGRRIGIVNAKNKKEAMKSCYIDATSYLEKCDPGLWREFSEKAKTGKDMGLALAYMQMSERLEEDIRDINWRMKRSTLFRNMPEATGATEGGYIEKPSSSRGPYILNPRKLHAKSEDLLRRRKAYLSDPAHEAMRHARQGLPVYSKAEDIVRHIEESDVTVLMAATGSGKTTQVPQLILDAYIEKREGAKCNIFCTQPRRLAAISVAQRVAKERGERVGRGGSIGYHVRFESALPDENGSVTFCTIGVFLRRMQSALQRGYDRVLDSVTHIVVDEVHERDIDTDLLLVVLKRLLEDRRAKGNPLKVILMSATVDPTLFQNYFPDADGRPAGLIDIPGRSFPVEKHFLEEFLPTIVQKYGESRWVLADEKVVKYIHQELPNFARLLPRSRTLDHIAAKGDREEELEIPYALVALTISHVLRNSTSGHVLVFLPGWEEIQSVQRLLTSCDRSQSFGVDFNDRSKYSLHVLHSSIPLAEQQVIFDPPPEGVRRVILSTNVAETSVTIPDVVYVVDTAKIKENQYDPERHISSLVSTWVGKSNLNQRAGRAGRHRPGEYYGILSRQRADNLHTHQTVEMKRMDLSNVVMHVKALDFPGMEAEDVLARTIEPPSVERVAAAMENLQMVGALDRDKNLTSLGRILLQLPLDVQLGRLVLYGSLFKCLDQAITLAAIFSNRDPFLAPPTMRKEAHAVKASWCPDDFRSDVLASLRAFNAWYEYEREGDSRGAARFCTENFLSRPTLTMVAKVKKHLLESLAQTGILNISLGGSLDTRHLRSVPPELNANGVSLPLLAALTAIANQPKFAIRSGQLTYRTALDRLTIMHPSSVNNRKRIQDDALISREKELFAYSEKRQNLSMVGHGPGQMTLVGTTRLDPMTYVLFGAYNLEAADRGLECDEWIQITGNVDALDEVRRLKLLMEACMLRIFEGVNNENARGLHQQRNPALASNKYVPPALRLNRDIDEDESGDEEEDPSRSRGPLADTEMREVGQFTQAVVDILDRYADERRESRSRMTSRSATPTFTPSMAPRSLPGSGWRSGASTPLRYESRPSTPSWLSAKGGW